MNMVNFDHNAGFLSFAFGHVEMLCPTGPRYQIELLRKQGQWRPGRAGGVPCHGWSMLV